MLVKLAYPKDGFSFADFKADVTAIITGGVTTVNDLSTSASKTDSAVIGTNTSGLFTLEDAASHTFSKTHHLDATKKTYFRLAYNDSLGRMTQLLIAQDYISGTNTLVNSGTTSSANIVPMTYVPGDDYMPAKVYVIVTKYGFYITSFVQSIVTYNGALPGFGLFDISETGLMKLESEMSRHVAIQPTTYGYVRSPWYLTVGNSNSTYTKTYASRNEKTGPVLFGNSMSQSYDTLQDDGTWLVYETPYHYQDYYHRYDTWKVYGVNYLGSFLSGAGSPLKQFDTYTGDDGSTKMVFSQYGARATQSSTPDGSGSSSQNFRISIVIEE